jgi:hypothetical protein
MNVTIPIVINSDMSIVFKKQPRVFGTEVYAIQSNYLSIDAVDKESLVGQQELSPPILRLRTDEKEKHTSITWFIVFLFMSFLINMIDLKLKLLTVSNQNNLRKIKTLDEVSGK